MSWPQRTARPGEEDEHEIADACARRRDRADRRPASAGAVTSAHQHHETTEAATAKTVETTKKVS